MDGITKKYQLKNKWNSQYLGELLWNDQFNPAPLANRNRMMQTCADMNADSLVLDSTFTLCPFKKFYDTVGATAWNGYTDTAFNAAFKNWSETDTNGIDYTNK